MAYHIIGASLLSPYGGFLVPGQSPEISQVSASSSPVSHNSQRQCPECIEARFRKHWCSPGHFENNTGYCSDCPMICSTCKPRGTLRKKKEYDETHWNNVKWYPDRQFTCLVCQQAQQTEKFQCARCVVSGEKQWFGQEHFNPRDLKNRKYRKTLDGLQCRQP